MIFLPTTVSQPQLLQNGFKVLLQLGIKNRIFIFIIFHFLAGIHGSYSFRILGTLPVNNHSQPVITLAPILFMMPCMGAMNLLHFFVWQKQSQPRFPDIVKQETEFPAAQIQRSHIESAPMGEPIGEFRTLFRSKHNRSFTLRKGGG